MSAARLWAAVAARGRGYRVLPPETPIVEDLAGIGSASTSVTTYPETGSVTTGDWYVDPAAVTNGTGTSSSPFDNLASALSVAGSGDIILVKAGTLTPSARHRLQGSNVRIFNYGTDRPIINCVNLASGSGSRVFTIEGSGAYHIKGFEIINSKEYPVLVNSANNTLEDLWLHDNHNTNVYLYGTGANDNLVQDCAVWKVGDGVTAEYDDDCYAATADSGTTNSGNKFVRCFAANGPDDNFDFFRGENVQVIDCVSFEAGKYWNGTNSGDGQGFKMGGQAGNSSVVGSIAVDSRSQNFDANSEGTITMRRNTAVGAGLYGFNPYASPASGIQDNVSIGNATEREGTLGTYNTWNASSEAGGNTDFPITNPVFADTAAFDWSLGAGSPAIGAGVSGGNLGASSVALAIAKEWLAKDLTV